MKLCANPQGTTEISGPDTHINNCAFVFYYMLCSLKGQDCKKARPNFHPNKDIIIIIIIIIKQFSNVNC